MPGQNNSTEKWRSSNQNCLGPNHFKLTNQVLVSSDTILYKNNPSTIWVTVG